MYVNKKLPKIIARSFMFSDCSYTYLFQACTVSIYWTELNGEHLLNCIWLRLMHPWSMLQACGSGSGCFDQIRVYTTGSGFVHNAQIQNFFIIQLLFNYLSTKVTRKFNLLNKLIFFQLSFINKSFDILNILNFLIFFCSGCVFLGVGSGISLPGSLTQQDPFLVKTLRSKIPLE